MVLTPSCEVKEPHSCKVSTQYFSHSMNFAILMVPHGSLDGSGGMPPVPPRFSMSALNIIQNHSVA